MYRIHHQGDKIPPIRLFLQEAHGLTSQKTAFFTAHSSTATETGKCPAVAQAIDRRLHTAAARAKSRGICVGQSGADKVFFEYFRFLCQSFIPLTVPQ
jgi:hypothetical protein